ncbi:MAG: radical SAM protein [Candidatus Marinimicrobia bacterium]|nr:radical SAM protein [Candidatus Neomarinimicrobiota bacterium]
MKSQQRIVYSIMYKTITCKTALNHIKSNYLPYKWDLNIYRGCMHQCQYCYALYSHKYLDSSDFFGEIYIKENIVECLEKKLRSRYWKRETINLGGVTDSYQPIEAKKKLMPEILKLLIKYKTPASISTKSTLVLRDLDLYDELARVAGVNIALSITCCDENIRKKIEPYSTPTAARFDVLKTFRKTEASTGVLMMPILPFLTDTEENLTCLFRSAQAADVDYIIPGLLNLRGPTRGNFLHFIKTQFPDMYPKYLDYYQGSFAKKTYRTALYERIAALKKAYPLSPKKHIPRRAETQLELF